MTVARFGRITPVQGDMLQLAGNVLSRQSDVDVTDEQRIAAIEAGQAALVARVGRDLGYELGPWHELLSSDHELRGEYQHSYGWRGVRAAIERALLDPRRENLLAALRSRCPPSS